jgi:2-polyprenyl-3-methyl-5-hydroxy-6-metoxy-1,4-benzoquinol methylase
MAVPDNHERVLHRWTIVMTPLKNLKKLVLKNSYVYDLRTRFLGKKVFAGNIFERFHGLDLLLPKCSGCTVLDFGSSYGLFSYEFARHGATTIHGFERDRSAVKFAKTLFQYVPIESAFMQANLAIPVEVFERKYAAQLLPQYDIVLFLGVYHHLLRQMPKDELHELIVALLHRCKKWFVVRTDQDSSEFEELIVNQGFVLGYFLQAPDEKLGPLSVYEKKSRAQSPGEILLGSEPK